MPRGSSPKRERQYEHIKESAEQRGAGEGRAKEMASRTVNKERARSGESKTTSRTPARSASSAKGTSSGKRGGQRSGQGSQEPTYDQLYQEAKRRDVHGRSNMNKGELRRALGK
ncbi:plasmid stabilization protein [Streptomyces sp. NPDC090994]|uniref:plasmid stabilization protein n=1 Tax=Streptomyces sp. NPDC090994 TaxID=3365969 RepID=UPI00381561C1